MQITRHTMQFLILSSKLSLTVSQAKLAQWTLELNMTCRISVVRKRMSYLPPFPQFHLGFSTALTAASVYALTTKQLLAQKRSNANSLSFAQSFHTILRSIQMGPRMELEQQRTAAATPNCQNSSLS